MNLDFVEYQLDVLLFGEDFEKEQLVTDFLKNEHRYEEVRKKPICEYAGISSVSAYAREHGEPGSIPAVPPGEHRLPRRILRKPFSRTLTASA